MTEGHRTVSRVIRILETVARRRDGVTLMELCQDLNAPRSSVHGFVRGLVAEGYLEERDGSGGYVLGVGAHTLLASSSTSLLEIVRPVMRELRDRLTETVTLSVPVGRDIAYVSSFQPDHPITYSPRLHTRRHPWPTSTGKIFMAFGAFGSGWTSADIHRELGPEAVNEVANVLENGFATNIGESVTDVAAVAVGVEISGRMVAALSIGGPRARIEPRLMDAAGLAHELLVLKGLSSLPL
ncbi:IclR family transcriptional regulator [Crystallibacter crystallopoietes]|nr:helix-turn-helix domain-containing protein [Arthrobacter crystallopoietes]